MDRRTLSYYDGNATEAAKRYESADASRIHGNLLGAFTPGSRLLELGCGSGRDAAFLLSRGYEVVAVDASSGMIAEAVRLHPELKGRLTCHGLPDPLPFNDGSFDGTFAVALLMHLSREDIAPSLREVARVIRPGGRFLFSIPNLRKDPIESERDPLGRLFTTLAPGDWIVLAGENGFQPVSTIVDQDGLNRSGYSWLTFILSR
jgi:SAM-dependent methyltransferase